MNRLKWQWDENPMLPLLLFLATGIWSAGEIAWEANLVFALIFGLIWLIAYFLRNRHHRIPGILRTTMALFLFWSAGAGLRVFRSANIDLPEHNAIHGIVTEPGELQENGSRRCLARIVGVRKNDGSWEEIKGQAIVYFRGQAAAGFRSGQSFVAGSSLRGIPAPALPGAFNAKNWYHHQGIYWQVFIPEKNLRTLNPVPPASIRQTAMRIRNLIESQFKKALPQDSDAAMMSALLLGIRRKMDPELKDAYAAAGLTHILAVSGMHVALIYGFLSFLLSGLQKFRYGRILFSAAITLTLWFYALVTGLSPSVLRAVCLFSIMQLSDVLRKPSLPVNNLCFASIILLMADENLLYDLGFQLSFTAVYGILSFQPAISGFWQPSGKIGKFLQENLSVTMAASIATLPLIVYHFHRFPVYFLLSNLFAVPFSNILIYAGIALIAFSPVAALSKITGTMLHYAIFLLNEFVTLINSAPFSSLNNLYPSLFTCMLFLPVIFALQIWMVTKRTLFLNLIFSAILAIGFLQVFSNLNNQEVTQTFVFRYKKTWGILNKWGQDGSLKLLGRGLDFPEFLQAGFRLKSMSKSRCTGISVTQNLPEGGKSRLCRTNGKLFLILNQYLKGPAPAVPIPIHIIISDSAGEKTLLQALKFFKPDEIWLDWNELRYQKLLKSYRHLPPVINFRTKKIRQIQCSGEKDHQAVNPESEDSKTS